MRKEICEHRIPKLTIEACKQYVYERRNVFDTYTRRYVYSVDPVIIKEISVSPAGEKSYWFWTFIGQYCITYEFDGKPTKKQLEEMWKSIRQECGKIAA